MSTLHQHLTVLLWLHRRMAEGQGDTPESETLRERLDTTWHALGQSDRELVRQVSAALNGE